MQVFSVLSFVLASASAEVFFEESFDGDWASRWTIGKPAGKEMGKWDVTNGKWYVDAEVNKGLTVTEDMRFYSITSKMAKKASSKGKPIVVQFSAKIENHQYAYCGGGYLKLLPEPKTDYSAFGGDDDYHVMFGPDLCGCVPHAPRLDALLRCGRFQPAEPHRPADMSLPHLHPRPRSYDVSHIHAIFNNKGENLLKTEKVSLEYSDKNEYTHLYASRRLTTNPGFCHHVARRSPRARRLCWPSAPFAASVAPCPLERACPPPAQVHLRVQAGRHLLDPLRPQGEGCGQDRRGLGLPQADDRRPRGQEAR